MTSTDEDKSQYEGRDFYEVFGVKRDASLKDIQRAYRTLALKVHPDRNGNSAKSTRDFQELSRMMEILSDPNRRSDYDNLGDNIGYDDVLPADHWRSVFRTVTKQDIEAYETTYYNSSEERSDVLYYYKKFQGDMSKMLEWIPLSDPSYLERYQSIIEEAVGGGLTELYPKWKDAQNAADKYKQKYSQEEAESQQMIQTATRKYKPFLTSNNGEEKNLPGS